MSIVRPCDQFVESVDQGPDQPPNLECWLTEPGRQTQFGAFIHVLQPGTRSSLKHWHRDEDELVYVLEGELLLVEGDQEAVLRPGDAATFRAGDPVGHFLRNPGDQTARMLVVGTRAERDCITYPDHGRQLHRDRSEPEDTWTDLEGRPSSNPYRAQAERG